MRKNIKLLFLVFMMILLVMAPSIASTPANYRIVVNAQEVTLKDPVQFEGWRALVPINGVFERLGAQVSFNEVQKKILVEDGYTLIEMTLDQKKAFVHKKYDFSGIPMEVNLDAAPRLASGIYYIPLRFTAESLGAKVEWNGETHTAFISTGSDIVPVEKPAEYIIISPSDLDREELEKWYEERYQTKGLHPYSFEGDTYILISAGEKPTGGYGLNMESATVVAPGSLYLTARVTKPAPDAFVTMAITYPNVLIKLENQTFDVIDGDIQE